MLELEVAYLEQHLLSLYRKALVQQLSSVSPSTKEERLKSPLATHSAFVEVSKADILSKGGCSGVRYNGHDFETNPAKEKPLDSRVYRCHSSLSHSSAFTTAISPSPQSLAKAAYHSRQLSMMEVYQLWLNYCNFFQFENFDIGFIPYSVLIQLHQV